MDFFQEPSIKGTRDSLGKFFRREYLKVGNMEYSLGSRYFLHRSLSVILNRFHPRIRKGLRLPILDSEGSLNYLLANPYLSITRWGDGESMLAIGGQTPFQKNSQALMRELQDVLRNSQNLPYVVALPWRFMVEPHNPETWGTWKHSRYICHEFADLEKPCLDAHMFRNESASGNLRLGDDRIERLWTSATHLILAVNSSKLFDKFAASYPSHICHYIEVPAKNAYESLGAIQKRLDAILSGLDPSKTRFLLSVGPTSKMLVALNCKRLVCYDLGHYFQHRYNMRKED